MYVCMSVSVSLFKTLLLFYFHYLTNHSPYFMCFIDVRKYRVYINMIKGMLVFLFTNRV